VKFDFQTNIIIRVNDSDVELLTFLSELQAK